MAPIWIGVEYGGVYGTGAGLLFMEGELLYNAANDFWDTVQRNMQPFHFSAGNIRRGFGGR